MELTYDEIEGYIETISNGKKIIVINDVLYVLKYPSMFDRLMARHFCNVELKKAIDDGIYTNSQMEELIKKRGLFTSEDIKRLGVLHNKLDAQKVVLAKTTKVKAKRDRVKNIIIKIENDIIINDKLFFIAKKVRTVSNITNPSYRPIVKLNRIGFNKELIKIANHLLEIRDNLLEKGHKATLLHELDKVSTRLIFAAKSNNPEDIPTKEELLNLLKELQVKILIISYYSRTSKFFEEDKSIEREKFDDGEIDNTDLFNELIDKGIVQRKSNREEYFLTREWLKKLNLLLRTQQLIVIYDRDDYITFKLIRYTSKGNTI